MNFEQPAEENANEEESHHFIPQPDTPRIYEANNAQTPISKELHAYGHVTGIEHEQINETREEILSKYGIPEDHIIVVELPKDSKIRRVRAFTLLKSKSEPDKSYYAEGHIAHANLLDRIFEKFGPEFGMKDVFDLDFDAWVIKKGFIDPHHENFHGFPEARDALTSLLKQNREINGYTEEEFNSMLQKDIPNWFLSGDTEQETA